MPEEYKTISDEEDFLPEESETGDGIDYKALIKDGQKKLAVLQQRMKAKKLPVVILFEGWGASGKGAIISKLIAELDPRGFKVYSTGAPTQDERRYPLLRRFWTKIPEYGWFSIFDRSWYRDVSIAAVEEGISSHELNNRFDEILEFERQLVDDGYVIIKFFLQISKKEQKKRLERLESVKATRWRVTADDWRRNRMYGDYREAFRTMIARTDRDYAPWIPINAKNRRRATYEVCRTVIERIERALSEEMPKSADAIRVDPDISSYPLPALSEVNLNAAIAEETYRQTLKTAQNRLFELNNLLYQRRIPLIIVYEGWDAAGKGGNIKRLTDGLDPRGYEVIPIAAPTPAELHHQYLWRFWNAIPRDGHIAIFDRSWYGRVMVERLEGFCTEAQWKRAFDEMNHFERSLSRWGAIIIKFWLQIDPDEQLRRFTERQNTPEKQWKITDEDWRNREKWDAYEVAVNDMLRYTNTQYAPWVIVESNDKKYARIKALENVIDIIEKNLDK